jgi:Flp pilus assembly protein TadG
MRRDERGIAAVELVLLVPAFLVLMYFVVGLGRLGLARGDVDATARDAARAGSLARTPDEATAAAQAAAETALADHDLTCASIAVTVDTSQFAPGGWVRAEVRCTVALGDLFGVWAPGSRTMVGNGQAVVDVYRSGA